MDEICFNEIIELEVYPSGKIIKMQFKVYGNRGLGFLLLGESPTLSDSRIEKPNDLQRVYLSLTWSQEPQVRERIEMWYVLRRLWNAASRKTRPWSRHSEGGRACGIEGASTGSGSWRHLDKRARSGSCSLPRGMREPSLDHQADTVINITQLAICRTIALRLFVSNVQA